MSVSQYGIPVAVKFSPAGIERFSMSHVETISLDQNTVPLRCAPRYAARARIITRRLSPKSRRNPSYTDAV